MRWEPAAPPAGSVAVSPAHMPSNSGPCSNAQARHSPASGHRWTPGRPGVLAPLDEPRHSAGASRQAASAWKGGRRLRDPPCLPGPCLDVLPLPDPACSDDVFGIWESTFASHLIDTLGRDAEQLGDLSNAHQIHSTMVLVDHQDVVYAW